MERAREIFAKRLVLDLDQQKAANGFINALKQALVPYREGSCPIRINYHRTDAVARLDFDKEWRVRPTDQLLERLRDLAGENRVYMEY
jgi:DNA polymerase-3 subunit alpha